MRRRSTHVEASGSTGRAAARVRSGPSAQRAPATRSSDSAVRATAPSPVAAAVRLGGAIGNLSVPMTEPDEFDVADATRSPGTAVSGGNQSGGATEALADTTHPPPLGPGSAVY